MRVGGRAGALLVAFVVALAVPALAQGHATLLATQPQASGVLSQPPTQVRLTYSERIEPRFAVISVTDAGGNQEIAGSPARAADDENSIFVPVKALSQGWYLVWWRVISADGHPVRGAFTFAVGPSPGPPPQFVIPSLGESAATPSLVGSRWVAAAGDAGRHRPARVPRRDRTAAAGDGRQRARPAGRDDCRGRRPRGRPRRRPGVSAARDRGILAETVERHRRGRAARARLRLRSRVQRSLDRARTARRRRRGGPRARPSGTQAAFRGGIAGGTRRGRVCRGRARLPGPCGPPVDDQPRRSHARARLGASGRSVDLDRRARRPARPGGDDAGGEALRGARGRRPALLARGHGQRRRPARDRASSRASSICRR